MFHRLGVDEECRYLPVLEPAERQTACVDRLTVQW